MDAHVGKRFFNYRVDNIGYFGCVAVEGIMDGCRHHLSRFTISGPLTAMKGSYFDRECKECAHEKTKVCKKCKPAVKDRFRRKDRNA